MGPARVAYRTLSLTDGEFAGTGTTPAGIELAAPVAVREYADPFAPAPAPRRYLHGTWTSAESGSGFVLTDLVSTWHASTPDGSWIELAGRTRSARTGRWSRWLILARWADADSSVRPTSVPGESCDVADVGTDVLWTPAGADSWQLRVTLLRPERGSGPGPVLTYAGVMISGPARPDGLTPTNRPARAGRAGGRTLDVPALSQRVHAGHYPEWGGGGEVWCSPTSVAMVLAFWGRGPGEHELSWIPAHYPDRPVYHAVRHCWDYAYGGAGNWSFNAAYAARYGLRTSVTRLRDLGEAEGFTSAGIPLVASLRVSPADLTGAEYASGGHLLVVTGFTDEGDVTVNAPAAADQATLRRVYGRQEFERAWLGGSGGIVYIIHPPAVALPPRPAESNW